MKTIIFCAASLMDVSTLVNDCKKHNYSQIKSYVDLNQTLQELPSSGETILFIFNNLSVGDFPLKKDKHPEIALARAVKLKNKVCTVVLCQSYADPEVINHSIFDKKLDRMELNFRENFIRCISNK